VSTYPTTELVAFLRADVERELAWAQEDIAKQEARQAEGTHKDARRKLCLSIACPLCEVDAGEPCDYGPGVSMWPTHSWRDELAGAVSARAYEAAVERLEVETLLKARVVAAGRTWSEVPGAQRDRLRQLVAHPSPWADAEFAKVVAIVYVTRGES
jgi:hypothetical protein